MGAVVTPPLPSMLSEVSRTSRAPSLHGHCPASSLLRPHPSPSRRPPASHRWLWGAPDSAAFAVGRGGLLTSVTARGLTHHPCNGFVDGLQRLSFLPRCHPSYRALAFTLARLPPAEHVSFLWTHG